LQDGDVIHGLPITVMYLELLPVVFVNQALCTPTLIKKLESTDTTPSTGLYSQPFPWRA
jgi:hypothetical protein